MAAQNSQTLKDHNIKLIVNCQGPSATNYFENDTEMNIKYIRHPIAMWRMELTGAGPKQIREYFDKTFSQIDQALENGDSVLIHCLAGAHRAGTMTGAYLMYKQGLQCHNLQNYMVKIRPIVDLLPGLYEVLVVYQSALDFFKEQDAKSQKTLANHAEKHHQKKEKKSHADDSDADKSDKKNTKSKEEPVK